jgi:hypothetical protein
LRTVETTTGSDPQAPAPDQADPNGAPEMLDVARRLTLIATELETGVAVEPGDLLTPSEKLRAIADLIDRRAANAAPPSENRSGTT